MAKKLWSILTDDLDHCMYTQRTPVERHHVFGGACRAKSERYGFIAPLSPELHPNGVHAIPASAAIDMELKQRCQRYYERVYGTREQFIAEFIRSYL